MNNERVVKTTKTPPAIKPDERSFKIYINITDKLFEDAQYVGKMEIKEVDLDVADKLEFELKLLKKRGK